MRPCLFTAVLACSTSIALADDMADSPLKKGTGTLAQRQDRETLELRSGASPLFQRTAEPQSVAAEIDRLLNDCYEALGVSAAAACSDEDFLRRVAFDLAGRPPKPTGVLKFANAASPTKRSQAIDIYLSGDEWAANQASYWRDVVFSRATNQRATQSAGVFEEWLAGRLADGAGWNEIATEMITAAGDVRENGATGLIYAHDGNAEELAGEVSRIFLGIQIQCANCHDHPYDSWKREDFHTLAAFFPRVRVRPLPTAIPPTAEVASFDNLQSLAAASYRRSPEAFFGRLDSNSDGRIEQEEVAGTSFAGTFGRAVLYGDKDQDDALSLDELMSLPRPMNENRRTEWYMPDLSDPSTPGEVTRPRFFLDGVGAQLGTNDLNRRRLVAVAITDPGNVWFARSTVNRIWNELVGSGFYSPVDDMGPERDAVAADVLDLLCEGFVESGYDLKWLLATIANTAAYQRSLRTEEFVSTSDEAPFLAATPTRLRADHIYAAIVQVVGEPSPPRLPFFRRNQESRYAARSPRRQVVELFGIDPSTPHDETAGDVPQALFLMNGSLIQSRLKATGNGPLAQIVDETKSSEEIIERIYLLALSRLPAESETQLCLDFIKSSPHDLDAYEDLLWAVMNSAEFVTKR